MSAPPPYVPRPLETLKRRPVALWVAARLGAGTAVTLLRAVFLWQVYDVSHSMFYLGLVGLLQFLPAPLASLLGGSVADARDRKVIVLAAQSVALACSVLLALFSHLGVVRLPILFALVIVAASAASFESPARQATLPGLVPRIELPGVVTVFVTANALAFMTGPALGGAIVATGSVAAAYAVAAALYAVSIFLVTRMPPLPRASSEQPKRAVDLASIVEGIQFVAKQPALLGSMSLDMFAVLFGGASALLPVYANDILGVGAKGYGVLSSSLEIGGLLTSFVLLARRPVHRLGRSLVITVAVYGAATMIFGLSRSFPLSVAAYMAVGMADQVSVVIRGTIVQMSTPDELRGRVSSVNMLFIGASNQLGAAESGFVASIASSATFSVVSGGAACLVVVLIVALAIPQLMRFTAATTLRT